MSDFHAAKIWIDIDNSPHIPFFVPIIEELKSRGNGILVTSRDNAQVVELLKYHGLDSRTYGRHYGRHRYVKILGLGLRALQLAPLILREKPDIAISHGSRSQLILCSLLGLPSIAITDYEFATLRARGVRPRWLMVPDVVASGIEYIEPGSILTYPGIKEDVYVPRFRPAPGLRESLGVSAAEILVTIRPPATDAHYRSSDSETLFEDTVMFLATQEPVRMVVLPRHPHQADYLRQRWSELFVRGRMLIPSRVVDGLNLIWFSDLVISGGGTMNREAASLGVPVYSVFRGRVGAVDRYLEAAGRLVLLQKAEDLQQIRLTRRTVPVNPTVGAPPALATIVGHITSTIQHVCHTKTAVET